MHRGFADFFNLEAPEFAKRLKTISMEEFIKREGGANGRVPIPEEMRENVMNSAHHCDKRKASKSFCGYIDDFLDEVGHVPDFGAKNHCVVFDQTKFGGKSLPVASEKSVEKFCGVSHTSFIGSFRLDLKGSLLINGLLASSWRRIELDSIGHPNSKSIIWYTFRRDQKNIAF